MLKKNNAQFAVEFVILMAFMFFVFLGFLAVIASKILESKETERQKITEDIAIVAENEINLAKSATNGYSRNFNLPDKVKGNTYTIKIISNRELVVDYVDKEHILFLQENVVGNLNVGANLIKKDNGIVYINPK
ncbi:hypothetical protein HYX01_01005 [Candidatus Woesearchaeota archaeon]|nr:hypothetical protein [Candidatus Woesearchaeota archaeon]